MAMPALAVTLGRLQFRNPILVASGTFGYAREMAGIVDFSRLGGIIPKTVTQHPRAGNVPPRTIETASGMLNAIGLDNDGIDHFIHHHLPYLRALPTAIIASIAGETEDRTLEFLDVHSQQRSAIWRAKVFSGLSVVGHESYLNYWEGTLLEQSQQMKYPIGIYGAQCLGCVPPFECVCCCEACLCLRLLPRRRITLHTPPTS